MNDNILQARKAFKFNAEDNAFDAISITVASPEQIRSWSYGEVRNPETINYRTEKPEPDGLFCEKIFGPTKDYECYCGRFKGPNPKNREDIGKLCPHCHVEITKSRVRRERMGHIELAVPVSHIWFFKSLPSSIGTMLNMSNKDLEDVIYYEKYVVTDPGDTDLEAGQVMDSDSYRKAREDYGDAFSAEMGAGALRTLLENLDLDELKSELELQLSEVSNKQLREKLSKRLRLTEGFIRSNSRPEYMILMLLPVIPPDLRPLVPLGGGRFATSDLNDLYRRVINRNNRLRDYLRLEPPDVIVRNEKRMLQEAVDSLFDNGRHGKAVAGTNGRALKSLADMLKSKQGRFRQNLLGKRVDYSGRSVIVVGPELKIHQCGLPKKMALELFSPFVIRRLKLWAQEQGGDLKISAAKSMIEKGDPVVWDILEEVTKGHPVMLNRAPTLHRLSIQAFDPVLIEGLAIRLHPLVCTAFNADFDGDQMAVHVPLSNEAQMEAKLLMLSPNNIFSPASGNPIVSPTQDIVLGCYYLTYEPQNREKAKYYRDYFEVLYAKDCGLISMHDAVYVPNPDYGKDTPCGRAEDKDKKFILTTAGRCIFNEIWDKRLGFINEQVRKKDLGRFISKSYQVSGHAATIKLLDDLKDMGYKHATLAGFSISIADVKVPSEKPQLIEDARKQVEEKLKQAKAGAISANECHNDIVNIWQKADDDLKKILVDMFVEANKRGELNPVYAMMHSGARGSENQVKQLTGMRGLMSKPNGKVIEQPILSNFREGLSVLEYFISTHGARKGLTDTALKTADSGYMTRRLVDVAQNVICREDDCGTVHGVWKMAISDGSASVPLEKRIIGRYSAQDIPDPRFNDGRLIVAAGEQITPAVASEIVKCDIQRVMVRSALTCETVGGICAKCYGRNMANDRETRIGDALGIIAAQSIGEPGTQLTMRTFHQGGTADLKNSDTNYYAGHKGRLKYSNIRVVQQHEVVEDADGKKTEIVHNVVVNQGGILVIYDPEKAERMAEARRNELKLEAELMGTVYDENYPFMNDAIEESKLEQFAVDQGSRIIKNDGDDIEEKDLLVTWEANFEPIIAESDGTLKHENFIYGLTVEKEKGGAIRVKENSSGLLPQLQILDETGSVLNSYPLQQNTTVRAKDRSQVKTGQILASMPKQAAKSNDITGGLPRVSELFDATMPKEVAEIAHIDGIVELVKEKASGSSKRTKITIRNLESNQADEHTINGNKTIKVKQGEEVKRGQMLTAGSPALADYLSALGPNELQRTLVDEVQKVYSAQGVEINDKHIEIIIRQMMQMVKIKDPGSSEYQRGEEVFRTEVVKVNREITERGGKLATYEPVLKGITKAALAVDSFISAASFQQTTHVLTQAAAVGKEDHLCGFKENVITGHLIPAGTGSEFMRNIKLVYLGSEIEAPAKDEAERSRRTRQSWKNEDEDSKEELIFEPADVNPEDGMEIYGEDGRPESDGGDGNANE